MAYNNAFPVGYQPMYYPNFPQPNIPAVNVPQNNAPQPVQNQNNSNIIWVKEGDVKGYNVTPNNAVALWDSEKQTIYIKQTDATGRPTIKTLDYTVREDEKVIDDKKDLDDKLTALQGEIEGLKRQMESLKKGKKKNEPVISDDDAE